MKIIYSNLKEIGITQEELKRSVKLLHKTLSNYGIIQYKIMKKMLTTALAANYYQPSRWIPFSMFLDRNENLLKMNYDWETIEARNGFNSCVPFFFSIPKETYHELQTYEIITYFKNNKRL